MKRNIIPFIIFFIVASLSAQNPSLKSVLSTAEKSMAAKNYYDALDKYQEALKFNAEQIDYLYKAAEAARLHGAYKISSQYYDLVLKHSENGKYPLAGFWLGQVKQFQGDYENAQLAYTSYKTEHSGEDPYYTALAEKEIKACEWAKQQVKNPVKGTTLTNMGEKINSQFSDFAPTPFMDELYYSSLRFENKVNVSLPKRNLGGLLRSKKGEEGFRFGEEQLKFPGKTVANSSLNYKNNKVCFTVCEDINYHDKRCDLYMATVDKSGLWLDPIKLPEFINIATSTQTQPNLTYNPELKKEILYYASNREGGKGGFDIWFSIIDDAGNYSEPVNLTEINTAQDDVTPFYFASTKTFYYSSKGHLGLGGLDVYSAKATVDGWTIKNLGAPLNSSFDDLYFIKAQNGTDNYLASNRTGSIFLDDANEACCLDLYKVTILPCEIKLISMVFDAATLDSLKGATLKLYDVKEPNSSPIIITKDMSNLFEFPISCEKEYRLEASKPGYTTETITFLSGRPGEFTEILKKIYLKRAKIQLDALTFDKQSGDELNGTTVVLYDLTDPKIPPVSLTNLSTNLSQFEVVNCHEYRLVATKTGYASVIKDFKIDCNQIDKVIQKLYLDRELYSMLPLALYFDNDRPNPSSLSKTTSLTYTQTYNSYYLRKGIFTLKFKKLFNKQEQDSAVTAMDKFFEKDVKGGKEKLDLFLGILELELAKGKKYEIFLKGYASPLANSEYNYILGQRRIYSVKNEFSKYKNGKLKKYIKTGQLKVTEKSFGEATAPVNISDKVNDVKSIYHINASKERRVEIIEIKE